VNAVQAQKHFQISRRSALSGGIWHDVLEPASSNAYSNATLWSGLSEFLHL